MTTPTAAMSAKEEEAKYEKASRFNHPIEPTKGYCTCGFCGSYYRGWSDSASYDCRSTRIEEAVKVLENARAMVVAGDASFAERDITDAISILTEEGRP